MHIVVQYLDETYEMVIEHRLNELVRSGKIKGFSSLTGWVRIEPPHDGARNVVQVQQHRFGDRKTEGVVLL